MRRGLLLSLSVGLLSVLAGCHHCRGVCDCQVHPIDHCTPSPVIKPGPIVSPPLQPTAASTMNGPMQ